LLAVLSGAALVGPAALARAASPSGLLAGGVAAAWFLYAGGFPVLGAFTALVVFGTAASRIGRARKAEFGAAEARGGRRSARNVLANAGPAAAGLVVAAFTDGVIAEAWRAAAAGALVAATADTTAGELGMLSAERPRRLLFGRFVARGENGGMTFAGTGWSLATAALGAAIAAALGSPESRTATAAAVFCGGACGPLVDSLLGATIEGRPGVGNETVNALASACGGLAAAALYRALA
jgi:uncharacterized protein (TIGR00297 family)